MKLTDEIRQAILDALQESESTVEAIYRRFRIEFQEFDEDRLRHPSSRYGGRKPCDLLFEQRERIRRIRVAASWLEAQS